MDDARPGTPTDNAFIPWPIRRMEHSPRGESFNGSLRDECLNVNWFASLAEAQRLVEAWRRDYNETRPHMTHNGKTPAEFAEISRPRHSGKVDKSPLDSNSRPGAPDPSVSRSISN